MLIFQVIEQTIADFTEKLRSRKAAQTLDIVRRLLQYNTAQCNAVVCQPVLFSFSFHDLLLVD